MRTSLTCLFVSFLLVSALSSAAQSRDLTDAVRRIYVEGMPYAVANSFTSRDTPTLLGMLRDADDAPYWPNIAMALGVIGDDRALRPLTDFIEGRDSTTEWSSALYRARVSAVGALGYLVYKSGNTDALRYLHDAVDPNYWIQQDIPWLETRPNADQLRLQLSTTAILGLALTGREEAANRLDELSAAATTPTTLKPVIQSAQNDLDIIRDTNLAAYYGTPMDGVPSGNEQRNFAVTWERLLNAAEEPHNWLMHNGTFDGQRFSRLDQIDRDNVADLEVKWTRDIRLGGVETTPLVVAGVLFVAESPSGVTALDATSGRLLWRYKRQLPEDLDVFREQPNRGLAILGDTLYMGTPDGHLVAIDARNGDVVWDAEVADYRNGYNEIAIPLVIKDRVVTAVASTPAFLDTRDARTGELAWRTAAVSGQDDAIAQTWFDMNAWSAFGDSWRTGRSGTEIYDPELNLVYWDTAIRSQQGAVELGPDGNLYSDAVFAMDGDTGTMSWYQTLISHDSVRSTVLADLEVDGERRKAMLWVQEGGFYHTLDRTTGALLEGAFGQRSSVEGSDTYPTVSALGPDGRRANGWSTAYNPRTELLYVSAVIGDDNTAGSVQSPVGTDDAGSALRAIDPTRGEVVWEQGRPQSGVLATAGHVVFHGTSDGFVAVNAETGQELWHMALGDAAKADPITYAVEGKQYVTMFEGNTLYTFGLRD